MLKFFLHFPLFLLLISCAPLRQPEPGPGMLAYVPVEADTLLARFAPIYLVENQEKLFNRIGTPIANDHGDGDVVVDPSTPSMYAEIREFSTVRNVYVNLIYRVHFPETPHGLIPFRLTAGKNVGHFFIVTLNGSQQPVLYTTVQTCGCYLAFTATSYLPESSWPKGWSKGEQMIYGETLPAYLSLEQYSPEREAILLVLRDATHRTTDISLVDRNELDRFVIKRIKMYPLADLERLPVATGGTTSFFVQSGPQEGFVKNNSKVWERILMSWWTFEWRIGEDKRLAENKDEPPVFFTSLKPWAREQSDMRDFAGFLSYWGWSL